MGICLPVRASKNPSGTYLFLSDIHVPYHDAVAIKLVLGFIKEQKLDAIYLIGDIVDFYTLSKYDKDPKRLLTLQDDVDQTVEILSAIRECAGEDTPIYYRSGNHEYRLDKYLVSHPEISQLRAMKLSSLLEFERLGIKEIKYTEYHELHGLQVEHGDIVRKRSGSTAGGMLDKRWKSGISGHTHRLGVHYVSNTSGNYFWAENGCLCSLDPHYLIGRPDWQQGFTLISKVDDHLLTEQARIVDGKLLFRDKKYFIDGRSTRAMKRS
jgi:UDP-2,3-diacylglucosamine pyrophosphatase LpxH